MLGLDVDAPNLDVLFSDAVPAQLARVCKREGKGEDDEVRAAHASVDIGSCCKTPRLLMDGGLWPGTSVCGPRGMVIYFHKVRKGKRKSSKGCANKGHGESHRFTIVVQPVSREM